MVDEHRRRVSGGIRARAAAGKEQGEGEELKQEPRHVDDSARSRVSTQVLGVSLQEEVDADF